MTVDRPSHGAGRSQHARLAPAPVLGVVLALLLAACAAARSAPPPLHPRTLERAIAVMLDDWHDAAAHADEARYFSHFAPRGVFLGTDASERWEVDAFRTYAHPHFGRGRAWTFRAVERHVTVRDANTAYFDERLDTARLGPARGSGVVVRGSDGRWRIAQYNLALTIPNDRFAEIRRVLESPPPDAH